VTDGDITVRKGFWGLDEIAHFYLDFRSCCVLFKVHFNI